MVAAAAQVSPFDEGLTRPSASRSPRSSPNVRGTLKREIIRCLKRYVAREVYEVLA
jgi:hypothetical protein